MSDDMLLGQRRDPEVVAARKAAIIHRKMTVDYVLERQEADRIAHALASRVVEEWLQWRYAKGLRGLWLRAETEVAEIDVTIGKKETDHMTVVVAKAMRARIRQIADRATGRRRERILRFPWDRTSFSKELERDRRRR